MTQQYSVQVRGVSIARDGRAILDNVDISVHSGQIVTVIGPNGAGKSTLLQVALGLAIPDSGIVVRPTNLRIGYQPQKLSLDASLPLSVRRFLTLTERRAPSELRMVLDDVGVGHLMDSSVHTLSGGELQRVMLARAALRRPDLLVLDEPTQNVDIAGAGEIYRFISKLRDTTGCGVLMVSHDLNVVMAATDNVYCLDGHIRCSGSPRTIGEHPAFREFVGSFGGPALAIYPHIENHARHH